MIGYYAVGPLKQVRNPRLPLFCLPQMRQHALVFGKPMPGCSNAQLSTTPLVIIGHDTQPISPCYVAWAPPGLFGKSFFPLLQALP